VSAAREKLLARRARLVERAESERHALAAQFAKWERPLNLVDKSVSILRALRTSPILRFGAGIGMAALAFTRPPSIVSWVATGQTIWKLIRGLRQKFSASGPSASTSN
jgi:hypothetical protein